MIVFSGTDRFEIRRCLGSGSFGIVYEAFDRERRTRLALKLPHAGSAQGLYLFKQEFRSLADVSHVNLITLFELLTDEDRWFFTMELVDGVHFLDYLRPHAGGYGLDSTDEPTTTGWAASDDRSSGVPRERMGNGWMEAQDPVDPVILPAPPSDYGRVRNALRQLAEGLLALHAEGMLHRDLKPSNVLVDWNGRVVILDFGLVTDMERSGEGDLLEGIAGTPSYMAPEQLEGHRTTTASDWYSVGVLLYQALTGRLPFPGGSRTALALKLKQDPLEPRLLVPGTPPDLDKLCMELLGRDPEARPCGQEVLERLLEHPVLHRIPETGTRSRSASLVGREEELAILAEGFRLIHGGRTVVALLHGDSGTGKSSLARGFLREIARLDDRAVVLQGRCYEQETVPFKALDSLVDALSQHLKLLPSREMDDLLPRNILALARLFPVLNQVHQIGNLPSGSEIPDAQELRRRAFGALREVLRRMVLRSPVVLIIDDMQWGDLDSVALLTELLRPPDPPPLMLLLCYRSEDARSSPALLELLPRLVESVTILQDVELRALSRSEARKLARLLLGADAPGVEEQADWIAAESGGSPFFVQELAQHIRRASPEERQGKERRLEDYVRIRVEALPEDSRNILQTLAIAGYPLDWEVLQRASGVEDASIASLTSLRAGHLIRMKASARRRTLETYHDRIRVAVVGSMDEAGVRAVNLALANTLEARSSSDAQALARHFEAAGVPSKASEYAGVAAAQAETSLAFDQAAALYRKALQLRGTGDPEKPVIRKRLGDALANAGRSSEAAQAYLEAAEGALDAEVNRLQRRAAEEYLRSGNIEAGLAILERVLVLTGACLPATRTRAMVSIIWNRLRLGLRGLSFKERTADQIPPGKLERVDTFWAVTMGLGPVDVLWAAVFQTRQLLLTLEAGEPFRVVRALAQETVLVAATGNRSLEKAQDLRDRTRALAERIGHPNPQARALMAEGITDTIQGRWRASTEHLGRAEEILKQNCTGMGWELHHAQHNALLSHLVLGDLPLIRERLPILLQEAKEKGDLIATTDLRVSLSYVLSLARDEPGIARRDLQAAIDAWSQKDFHLQHYHCLVSRVNIELYVGAFHDARRVLLDSEVKLERSLLLKIQPILITILELRARTALALAARASSPDRVAPLLKPARQSVRKLKAERTAYGGALALKLEAMEAAIQGRREEALAGFLRSERTFDACDMLLHVWAIRYCRGRLMGSEGRELMESAGALMRSKGIQNPGRYSAMHVPLPG